MRRQQVRYPEALRVGGDEAAYGLPSCAFMGAGLAFLAGLAVLQIMLRARADA